MREGGVREESVREHWFYYPSLPLLHTKPEFTCLSAHSCLALICLAVYGKCTLESIAVNCHPKQLIFSENDFV